MALLHHKRHNSLIDRPSLIRVYSIPAQPHAGISDYGSIIPLLAQWINFLPAYALPWGVCTCRTCHSREEGDRSVATARSPLSDSPLPSSLFPLPCALRALCRIPPKANRAEVPFRTSARPYTFRGVFYTPNSNGSGASKSNFQIAGSIFTTCFVLNASSAAMSHTDANMPHISFVRGLPPFLM